MIPETNPAPEPKQVKINGKQRTQPPPLSEKNGGATQGEYAKREGGGNEVFLRKMVIFHIKSLSESYTFIFMETVWNLSTKTYHLDLLMIFTSLLAIFFNLRRWNVDYRLNFFFIYPLASFCQTASLYITKILDLPLDSGKVVFIGSEIFNLFEITFIFYIFTILTLRKFFKKILISLCILYTPLYTYSLFLGLSELDSNSFYLVHNLIIIAGGVVSMLDVYLEKRDGKLERNPFFIISFGAIIMATCSLPLYVANDFIFNSGGVTEMSLFSINFACYSIFFTLISTAFICMKKQKQLDF